MLATDKAMTKRNKSTAIRITTRNLILEMVATPGSRALSTKHHNMHMIDTLMSQ